MIPQLEPLARDDFRISVVMPVFSETESVRTIANWLRTHLGSRLLEVIIVISPRSTQSSHDVCDELARNDPAIRVFQQEQNPGVGLAFREGYSRVRGNLVLSMDSDGEMDLATIPRMIDAMAERNVGVVVGSRWLPGGGFVGYPPVKRWFNWGFQQVFRILFRTPIHDLTYGFKLLRAELVHEIPWEGTLHEIGCETTLKPLRLGISLTEVPTTWVARKEGQSTNNFMRNFRYVGMACSILTRGVNLAAGERRRGTSTRVLPANEGSVT
jgi:dolichol-phosphate mannosyltransferase